MVRTPQTKTKSIGAKTVAQRKAAVQGKTPAGSRLKKTTTVAKKSTKETNGKTMATPQAKKSATLPPNSGGIRKPHRFRPGTVALREIRKYQKRTNLLIPKMPFSRLVRDLVVEMDPEGKTRFTPDALGALQEAVEAYAVSRIGGAQDCCEHAKRVTLMPHDLLLAVQLKEDDGRNTQGGFNEELRKYKLLN